MDSIVRVRRPLVKSGVVDKKRFKRLVTMDCFDDVMELIESGTPVAEIVSFIQEVKEEYVEVQPSSLEKLIKSFIQDEVMISHTLESPQKAQVIDQSQVRRIDVLAELQGLFSIQKARVEMSVEKEKQFGLLLPVTGKEVSRASELLGKIDDMQRELGINTDDRLRRRQTDLIAASESMTPLESTIMSNGKKRSAIISFVQKLEGLDPRVIEATIQSAERASLKPDVDESEEDE